MGWNIKSNSKYRLVPSSGVVLFSLRGGDLKRRMVHIRKEHSRRKRVVVLGDLSCVKKCLDENQIETLKAWNGPS